MSLVNSVMTVNDVLNVCLVWILSVQSHLLGTAFHCRSLAFKEPIFNFKSLFRGYLFTCAASSQVIPGCYHRINSFSVRQDLYIPSMKILFLKWMNYNLMSDFYPHLIDPVKTLNLLTLDLLLQPGAHSHSVDWHLDAENNPIQWRFTMYWTFCLT